MKPILITGDSASGKSTLTKVICGQFKVLELNDIVEIARITTDNWKFVVFHADTMKSAKEFLDFAKEKSFTTSLPYQSRPIVVDLTKYQFIVECPQKEKPMVDKKSVIHFHLV